MVRSHRGPDAQLMDTDPCDLPSDDDDYDPDYTEGESSEDDLPHTMGRDRAAWVEEHVEAIEDVFRAFKEAGQQVFGRAFFQAGNVTDFAKFVYKHTMPGAVSSN
tara:strand:- start:2773 stop:3087 length:315 start_codon:yes stop_codon:yes gene_type:complete